MGSSVLEDVRARQNPVGVRASVLKSYAGDYGNRKLFIEDGKLYFQREGDQKYILAAISQDLFRFVDTDDIRLKFLPGQGEVTGLQIIYKDGSSKMLQRTK